MLFSLTAEKLPHHRLDADKGSTTTCRSLFCACSALIVINTGTGFSLNFHLSF